MNKFMEIIKKNLEPVTGKKWKQTILLSTSGGKSVVISVTDKNEIFLNYDKQIKIISIEPVASTIVKKSTATKIGGGLLGGLFGGAVGAVIGSVALGNNKIDNTPKNMIIEYNYTKEDGALVNTNQILLYSKDKFTKLQELI